jgi:hypothetical protein
MRESDMRQRIEGLLRRRMKGVLAPTLGLGLAIIGCGCGGTEYGAQFPHPWDGGLPSVRLDADVEDAPAGDETSPADTDNGLDTAQDTELDSALVADRG